MSKNLVIVESPAKARTIEKILGKDFKVRSCNGHVRDLSPTSLSINIKDNFNPEYEALKEKSKLIKELQDEANKSDIVWLATDEDREGEAISWHLTEVLGLKKEKVKRIVFHEITKNAVLNAIENPRGIKESLVNAQQARRVLDRLVGYKLSPVLWRKVKPALSAGRVQSVAVRLIVEREREIINFNSVTFYRITAEFLLTEDNKKVLLKAELSDRLETYEEARKCLESLINSAFKVESVDKKMAKKHPAPPFTTSTLQQEASRKLGFSVSQTMQVAQKLYEAGHITYMRTDSVRLSDMAIATAKNEIIELFGEKYARPRNFETKTKSAQEAHEAIRPTYINNRTPNVAAQEKKLYELIWNRTLASQMAEAEVEKTNIRISASNCPKAFTASGEVIKFDGFLKLYIESTDDDSTENGQGILPAVNEGQSLFLQKATASERITRPPFRYSEAALVKKLEELGIGRPSTFAPTITTILKRGYVSKEVKEGKERQFVIMILENNTIGENTNKEVVGQERGKLSPSSIGMIVNDFLMENFEKIISYNFTADVENEFDNIADNKQEWQSMIASFYKDFEPLIIKAEQVLFKSTAERLLGQDPESGLNVYAKLGKYGPYAQIGEGNKEEKPRFAKFKTGLIIESITLEEALELFKIPRNIGKYEGYDLIVNIGRFGPYIDHNKSYFPIPKAYDPYTIGIEDAINVILKKKESDLNKLMESFEHEGETIRIMKGRFGPYINYKKKTYRIPKELKTQINLENVLEIIKTQDAQTAPKTTKKRKAGK